MRFNHRNQVQWSKRNGRNIPMRLFILGATGKTGRELVDLALEQGHQVTAFVRSPEKITVKHKRLKVIQGSPQDVPGMAKAMKGQAAVFSALGPQPKEVFTALKDRAWTMEHFAANILSAMKKAKVKRLVLFSTAGLFPNQNPFVRFLSFLARHHMKDLKGMEEAVAQSPADWTIVRPNWLAPGLDESYRAQKNALPPEPLKMTFHALAKFMLDSVTEGTYRKQIVGLAK